MQLQWRLETSGLCVTSDRISGRDFLEDRSEDLQHSMQHGALATNCDSPETVNDFIEHNVYLLFW